MKSLTEQWAEENGITEEQLAEAGLLPKQRLRRHSKGLRKLQELGLGSTPEARMLKHAVKTLKSEK